MGANESFKGSFDIFCISTPRTDRKPGNSALAGVIYLDMPRPIFDSIYEDAFLQSKYLALCNEAMYTYAI